MVKQIKVNNSHTARKCQSLDVNQAIWTCSYHAVPVHTWMNNSLELSSPQFSSIVSDSLWLHGLQHARLLCPSLTPGDCSNLCPSSQWCHPTISVIPFSSCPPPFPASGSFPMIQFFTSGGWSMSALPSFKWDMNIPVTIISTQQLHLLILPARFLKVFVFVVPEW